MTVPSIAVVIPAFNEELRLHATLQAIAEFGRDHAFAMPIVLADDGSADGTAAVAEQAARDEGLGIEVLRLPHLGKASAVRAGMLHAATRSSAEYLLMLDADNEIAIDQLAGVEWVAGQPAIYVGRRVRAVGGRVGARPTPLRRLMSFGMRTLNRVLLGLSMPDTQCGFKLFPRRVVGELFGQLQSRGWVFDAEILAIAVRSGITVREVPVVWSPRGVSRVGPATALTSVPAMLAIAWRIRTGRFRRVSATPVRIGEEPARSSL